MTRTEKPVRSAVPAILEVKLVTQHGVGFAEDVQGISGVETLLLHIAFCTYCGDSPRCLKTVDATFCCGAGEPAEGIIVDLGSCPLACGLSEGAPLPTFGTVEEAEVTADAKHPPGHLWFRAEGHQDFAPGWFASALSECYS